MIPVSLLLILVAVTLLVLGLTGGSSNLLISSIVASLLAAVALVIGARQAAGARRAAEQPAPGFPPGPQPAPAAEFAAEPEFAEAVREDLPPRDAAFAADSATARRDTVQFEPVAEPAQGDLSADEPMAAAHRPAGPDPDYDRAAEAINAARSGNAGRGEDVARGGNGGNGDAARGGDAGRDEDLVRDGHAGRRDVPAEDEADEFAEADADDPEDEPLPQAVRPADAVKVARLDAEVLVVDGRPRYHMADCSHLVGKLTEPIPVNEAVELGFSPCGLCRPVDRLVAATARR
nr:hypothetical protein [uncultured Actinoplanes sp.]